MPRYKLIQALEKAEISQSGLAALIWAERKAVNRWLRGEAEPRMEYREPIRRALKNNDDPDLFKNYPEGQYPDSVSHAANNCPQVQTSQQLSPSCQAMENRDIVESASPNPFTILGSVRGFKEFMDMLRRQFIEALAKLGWTSSFGNISIGLVSSPSVDPEEYLALCSESIGTWWQWLNEGNYPKLERVLYANVPILKRLATTISPFQSIAASLAAQAKFMQIILATRNFDYVGRELLCAEAVFFGRLSGNSGILATALEWQGGTYTYCYHESQTAIPLLNDALYSLNSETSLLSRSAIYMDLSVAYAQDNTQEDFESNARGYAELARTTMPEYPELDPLYPCIQYGLSELDQLEGKTYLYLAEHLSSRDYAQLAHDAFEKSMSKQAMNRAYLGQALIHRADAARLMGYMDECVTCLKDGYHIAVEINNMKRLNQASSVISSVPSEWMHETSVQQLQKAIAHAIIERR